MFRKNNSIFASKYLRKITVILQNLHKLIHLLIEIYIFNFINLSPLYYLFFFYLNQCQLLLDVCSRKTMLITKFEPSSPRWHRNRRDNRVVLIGAYFVRPNQILFWCSDGQRRRANDVVRDGGGGGGGGERRRKWNGCVCVWPSQCVVTSLFSLGWQAATPCQSTLLLPPFRSLVTSSSSVIYFFEPSSTHRRRLVRTLSVRRTIRFADLLTFVNIVTDSRLPSLFYNSTTLVSYMHFILID